MVPPMGHYRSYSYLKGNVGIFDVHPANCVISEGVLVPIDFILVRFGPDSLAMLEMRVS